MPRSTKEKLAQLNASEKKNRENAEAFAKGARRSNTSTDAGERLENTLRVVVDEQKDE